MKIIIIDNRLGLSGNYIEFKKESFFNVHVGDKVIQIGNGKENGTIRTDNFNYPVEYIGSIIVKFQQPEKMYAFKISEKINNENLYFIYGCSDSGEIFTEAVYSHKNRIDGKTTGYLRFYVPKFKFKKQLNKNYDTII